MQVVQAGRGAVRPLVVAYHVIANLRPHVSADTAILSYVGKPFSQSYAAFTGASPDLDAIATRYAAELGAEAFWPILLLGFSEGCQGIRTQLRAGFSPSAILAIDGIHSNLPPAPWQLEVWRDWFARCGADLAAGPQDHCPAVDGAPIAVVTFSQIPTEQQLIPAVFEAGEGDASQHEYEPDEEAILADLTATEQLTDRTDQRLAQTLGCLGADLLADPRTTDRACQTFARSVRQRRAHVGLQVAEVDGLDLVRHVVELDA